MLLKVHEAPYNSKSPITLLSEYQIREHGLVIDSVAKKHMSSHGKRGTQRLELNPRIHIDFEDRGGMMGFEILPFEKGDEYKYDIFTITSLLGKRGEAILDSTKKGEPIYYFANGSDLQPKGGISCLHIHKVKIS